MKTTLSTIILLSLFSCFACTSVEPEENFISNQIFPLAVGNKWEYKYDVFQNDTLIHSSISSIEVIDKIKIRFEGKEIEVFKVKQTKEAFLTKELIITYSLYNYEDTILYRYGFANSFDSSYYFRKDVYLKYPIKIGDKWFEDQGDYKNVFSCLSDNDEVIIENKKYSCIKIRTGNGITWYSDKYFSLGFGLIQEIAEVKTTSKRFEKTTLINLKIVKPT
ncbi:MAG: hypothetical protein N2321_01865 [Melioribacteraceae bacterium]|nr:hypothetical protein [Melioribacteraceae bacterium]